MYQLLNLRKQLKTLTKIYRQDINQDFIVHYIEEKWKERKSLASYLQYNVTIKILFRWQCLVSS